MEQNSGRDQPLRILTYNVYLRPYLIKTNEDDYKQERLDMMIHQFEEYDVVCLEECFDTFTHRQFDLISKLASKGFEYVATGDKVGLCEPKMIDGGLVVLSKFPIVQSEFIDFGTMGQSDGLSKKGILYCRIQVPQNDDSSGSFSGEIFEQKTEKQPCNLNPKSVYVNLFVTHTQANYFTLGEEQMIGCMYIQFDQILKIKESVERVYRKCKFTILDGA